MFIEKDVISKEDSVVFYLMGGLNRNITGCNKIRLGESNFEQFLR